MEWGRLLPVNIGDLGEDGIGPKLGKAAVDVAAAASWAKLMESRSMAVEFCVEGNILCVR